MNPGVSHDSAKPTIRLFALLFAIGSTYLASLGYFLARGTNFVDAEKVASATRFAQSTQLSLPTTLTFTETSGWSKSLSTGWSQPENWGVWSSRSTAAIVLPAIRDTSLTSACFSVRVGTMSKTPRWPMLVTINGHQLAPETVFQGEGPYVVHGSVPIQPDSLIYIQLAGPNPKIPNLISRHTTDPRDLAFQLMGIAVSAQCGPAM